MAPWAPSCSAGEALVLCFVGWNGWSLWLFGRHGTGLLPGQATHALIEEPYDEYTRRVRRWL